MSDKKQKKGLIESIIKDAIEYAIQKPDDFEEAIARISQDVSANTLYGRKFLILLAKFKKFSDAIWIQSTKARNKFLKNLTEDIYDFLLYRPNILKL